MRPSCRRQAQPRPRRRATIRRRGRIQLARADRRGPAPEGARPHGKPRQGSALRRPLRAAQQWLVHQVGRWSGESARTGKGTRPSRPWMTGPTPPRGCCAAITVITAAAARSPSCAAGHPPNAGGPRGGPRLGGDACRLVDPRAEGAGSNAARRFLARHRPGGAPASRRLARREGGALRVQPWSPLARMGVRPARAVPPASPRRVRWAISPKASCRTPTGPPRASPTPPLCWGTGACRARIGWLRNRRCSRPSPPGFRSSTCACPPRSARAIRCASTITPRGSPAASA